MKIIGEGEEALAQIAVRQIEALERDRRAMRDLLLEINNWLVCAPIATPEDMAQNFEPLHEKISTLLKRVPDA